MKRNMVLPRRLSAAFVGVVMASAMLALPSTPAYADNLDGNCDNNEICVYKNENHANGGVRDMDYDHADYDGNTFIHSCSLNCGLNDAVSSLHNEGGDEALFFQNYNGGGYILHVDSESSIKELTDETFPPGGDWNDRISSHCWDDASSPNWCG